MIDFSDVVIADHYKNLPTEIKSHLFTDDTNGVIFTICSQNKLSLDQMNMCADEVDLFLLGMTLPESFPKKLSARLESDPDLTNRIVDSLTAKLFTPLQEPLKALYKIADISFQKLLPPQAPNRVLEKSTVPQMNSAGISSSSTMAPLQKPTTPVAQASAAPISSISITTASAPISAPASQHITQRSIPIVIEKNLQSQPPIVSPAASPISSDYRAKLETTSITTSAPLAPLPPMPAQKQVASSPTPFAGGLPTATIQSAATSNIPPRRPLNWSDILANQSKESNEVGISHAKLERALNPGAPTQSAPKPIPASYIEHDPYREPIE